MATKQKEVTTFDVQVAEFIRNHKQKGTATDDEINASLVLPFTLDADGIEDLLQRIQDAGISITDNEGNPSARVLSAEEEPELSDEDQLALWVWITVGRPVVNVIRLRKMVGLSGKPFMEEVSFWFRAWSRQV